MRFTTLSLAALVLGTPALAATAEQWKNRSIYQYVSSLAFGPVLCLCQIDH